jgi:hypothetical protein
MSEVFLKVDPETGELLDIVDYPAEDGYIYIIEYC